MPSRDQKSALFEAIALTGKALASPVRLELLDLLAQAPRSVEELARASDQSNANASQHLQALRAAGLVERERDGNRVRYSLADEALRLWLALREVSAARLAEVERAARDYLGEDVEAIGRDELRARLARGEAVLVDVRPGEEFEAAHIDGARSIPLDELERRISELPPDREVIAYCRGPLCAYAHDAVRTLRTRGRVRAPARRRRTRMASSRNRTRGGRGMKQITVDVDLLRSEIEKTYTEVSTDRDKDFIFPTGRQWAEDLDYPQPELARVPDATVDSFAGVANHFALGRIERGATVLDLGCGAGTDLLIAAQMTGPDGMSDRHRHDPHDARPRPQQRRRDERPRPGGAPPRPDRDAAPSRRVDRHRDLQRSDRPRSPTRTRSSTRSTASSNPAGAYRSPT